MEPDVNFCTNCGADLRNVSVVNKAVPAQPTQPEKIVDTTMPTRPRRRTYEENNSQDNQKTTKGKSTQAAYHFDAQNMWRWFVNSWKHPFKEQKVDKWYGWVTLLVENILFALGLLIRSDNFMNFVETFMPQNFENCQIPETINNSSHSLIFEFLICLILTEIITIAGAYLGHKFVYGQTENLFDFINHIVGMSNLSAIFVIAAIIFMLISGDQNTFFLALFLDCLTIVFFSLACYSVVVADKQPAIHDRFYGLLIVFVIELLGIIISLFIFATNINNLFQNNFNPNGQDPYNN